MFNGLIREIATVYSLSAHELRLKSKFRPEAIGDSIAVNGACLSATAIYDDGFSVRLSSESVEHLAMINYKAKSRVHIEPAMRLGERIDGHLMQGHIDAIGKISKIVKRESGSDFYIDLPQYALPLVAHKGSIGVDGVSLTISEITATGVRLSIIPITLKDTLFGEYTVGRKVNIETDLLARYIQRQIEFKSQTNQKEEQWRQIELALRMY
ncbi:riboflavin synthase [Campylobacter sp. 19-13652]|uniref:riboflavin synthase n=1 Tax=Campylobacter sp. 19-13652 TaxID=2840180 RepID=UPI001C7812EE|nr:riboflavin synthase [Campylobacter sp. 19-13652]BCX79742.1 riboflavin synthase subunit alpha [Campylobacter sp. 19-13652]